MTRRLVSRASRYSGEGQRSTKWCAADPRPRFTQYEKNNRGPGSAVHRADLGGESGASGLRRAAPHPGHVDRFAIRTDFCAAHE